MSHWQTVVYRSFRTMIILWSAALAAAGPPAPGPLWPTATPESQGLSSAKLEALKNGLAARATKAFLVIRNDHIVYEWYSADHSVAKKHGTASMAKALVGGIGLALAVTDGRLSLDDPASRYIPQWQGDPLKSGITLRHLGSHTAGLADSEPKDESG